MLLLPLCFSRWDEIKYTNAHTDTCSYQSQCQIIIKWELLFSSNYRHKRFNTIRKILYHRQFLYVYRNHTLFNDRSNEYALFSKRHWRGKPHFCNKNNKHLREHGVLALIHSFKVVNIHNIGKPQRKCRYHFYQMNWYVCQMLCFHMYRSTYQNAINFTVWLKSTEQKIFQAKK